jgi:Serine/threonine protein kinase
MNSAEHSTQVLEMFNARVCSGCGARIRVGAPDGLCPRCLLGLALGLHPGDQSSLARNSFAADTLNSFPDSRRFGNYELTEEIARGGMGIVYRARQVSLNRTVAVKVLLFGQFSSAEFVKRFRAEAEAVASLRHPNIVGIHEVGEHEGQHFFSMDYIEGTNLAELAREKPLPAHAAALLLKTIGEALDYAHGCGILHRDLKPSNVLVDSAGQPHITDFGLAKRLSGDGHITLTGQIFGSPGYMAPEQASPGKVEVGRTSDIYSLGAILYYLLTGRAPFVAESVEATLAQVLTGEILSPRKLNPGLPADLETICLKCLEREPGRRYATAAELADELGRFLRGEPIRARPVSVIEKAWRWSKRNPVTSGLGAGLIVLLVAFIAYSLISSSRIRLEAAHARLAEQQARSELWQSYLEQARAERLSGQAGQRYASLEAIRRATAIRPSRELRNEAIAALALTDVRLIHTWPFTEGLVSYSSSLEKFAVVQQDGQVRICLASNGVETARLPTLASFPRWIQGFSPDERLLAVRYSNDLTYVWDLTSRQPILGSLEGAGCAFVPEGGEFLIVSSDSACRFYSTETGALIRSVMLPEPLDGVTLQPGQHFMGGFRHNSPVVHLLEFPSGRPLFKLTQPAEVGSIALSADGKWLAVGCYDRRVHVWNTATGASCAVLEGHENNIVALGFNHAGTLLATTSWDDTFRLWDTASWKQVLINTGTSFQMKFAPTDHAVAHLSHDGIAGVLEVGSSAEFRQLYVRPDAHQKGWSVALSPDGHLIATSHEDGVALRDVATGVELARVQMAPCRSVMFVPDGTALITSSEAGLALWPITNSIVNDTNQVCLGRPRSIREGLPFCAATLSGDGRWVAAANPRAGLVAVYELAHPENQFGLTNLPNVQFVSATADMRWLAGGAWGHGEVKVWNVAERRLERSLPVHGSASVALSPDGSLLAVGTFSYEVWQIGSWRKLYEVHKRDSENGLGLMVFSPDSRWLALLDDGRDIVLLEAATGNELARLQAPRRPGIGAFCFSADASKLVALQADQSLQIWDLRAMRRELAALNLDW